MSDEEPIGPDEYVLRRIHPNNCNPTDPISVKRCEFEPKQRDADGISLYREKITSAEQLSEAGKNPGSYYIARFHVSELQAIGLTVVPSPGDLPGHVSIPELSWARHGADKPRSKELQLALARLATDRIVLHPKKPNA